MKNIFLILDLLTDIIRKPICTIKGYKLLNYNKTVLTTIFLLMPLLFVYKFGIYGSFMILIGLYITRKIIVFFYYILIRTGTNNQITFKNLETLLLPFIFIILIAGVLSNYLKIPRIISHQIIIIWFHWQLYLILKCKLGQSKKRSIILLMISFILLKIKL